MYKSVCMCVHACVCLLGMQQCENTVSQNMAMQPSAGTQRAILLQSSLQ